MFNLPRETSDKISLAETITNLRHVCIVSTTVLSELDTKQRWLLSTGCGWHKEVAN
jgi:hypothetical protein